MAAAVIANAAGAVAQAQVVVIGSDTSLEGGATASFNGGVGETTNSVAIGSYATANAGSSIAIGYKAYAVTSGAVNGRYPVSIAIGWSASATAGDALAFGTNNIAAGVNSSSYGNQIKTSGANSIAIEGLTDGVWAPAGTTVEVIDAASTSGVAVGNYATIKGSVNAISIGTNASVASGAANSTALGKNASIGMGATGAIAFGSAANVNASATGAYWQLGYCKGS